MSPYLPNRGFTCKEIRMQEAEELYDLREAMEAFAVEKEEPTACTIRRGGLPPIKSTLSFLKRWSAGMWSPTVKPVAPSTTPVGRNPEREPPAKAGAGVEVSRRQCGSFARIFRKERVTRYPTLDSARRSATCALPRPSTNRNKPKEGRENNGSRPSN